MSISYKTHLTSSHLFQGGITRSHHKLPRRCQCDTLSTVATPLYRGIKNDYENYDNDDDGDGGDDSNSDVDDIGLPTLMAC